MKKAFVTLGDQLYHPRNLPECDYYFLAEDPGLCRRFHFHQQKLLFFLSSMRHYAQELSQQVGAEKVFHHKIEDTICDEMSYSERLLSFVSKNKIDEVLYFEIEDHDVELELFNALNDAGVSTQSLLSPGFIDTRESFEEYLSQGKKPFMKNYYEKRRKETGFLMEDSSPVGGKYSFDADNRKKLPKNEIVPVIKKKKLDEIDAKVVEAVEEHFSDHPGTLDDFLWPTSRAESEAWLESFLEERFELFGPYEDAIDHREPLLYHSGISALMNVGFIEPRNFIEKILDFGTKRKVALNSQEGLLRQVLGWREFIRGIYHHYGEFERQSNYWEHKRKLKESWYDGSTGIPPLDDSIKKVLKFSYNHHIERLMVLANLMTLSEIDPNEAHRWFMELYLDSSDWVMVPNVYGMGLFADGGVFSTKPYISGSNYILKMSSYSKGDWCDEWDGLFWHFIGKHEVFFSKNPRTKMLLGNLSRMPSDKKTRLENARKAFLKRNTAP